MAPAVRFELTWSFLDGVKVRWFQPLTQAGVLCRFSSLPRIQKTGHYRFRNSLRGTDLQTLPSYTVFF